MTTQADQKLVEKGEVKEVGAFGDKEWELVANHILKLWTERKLTREQNGLKKKWEEIDRQLRMEPRNPFKMLPSGKPDVKRRWMAEMELPLQAQTLEILTTDARRLTIPDTGTWYEAKVELSDEYTRDLQGFDLDVTGGIRETDKAPAARIAGDDNDLPSLFLQDQANKLLQGVQDYFRMQYDFGQTLDEINAEAFKYGTGIGRGRVVTKPQILSIASGDIGENTKFPALLPVSIKNTYLDDSPHAVLHEGMAYDGGVIQERTVKLDAVVLAATKGSSAGPNSVDGGWMPDNLKDFDSKNNDELDVLEFEGDLIVPRKTNGSIVQRGVLVTVVVGKGGDNKRCTRVIRFRFRKTPFSSYITFPYHCEDVNDAYATSPLMKGRPVQMAAVDALNRIMDAGALQTGPPVGYDRTDMWFAQRGGPQIAPFARWGTVGQINVHNEIGGDINGLLSVFGNLVQLYYDVTGATPARLGAETKSHTTAFAKQVEDQRGQSRTVDYVRNSLSGPLTRWLYMEKDLLRMTLTTSPQSVFIPAFEAWMEVTKDVLPKNAWYEAIGAAGPLEEERKKAQRFQSAQSALQIDLLGIQQGEPAVLSRAKLIDALLSEGGWTDIDALKSESAVLGNQQGGAPPAGGGNAAALPAALQAVSQTVAAGR